VFENGKENGVINEIACQIKDKMIRITLAISRDDISR
jgi:hypothetical protein